MTSEEQKQIDAMSQEEMAQLWRFAPAGHPLLAGETGDYFQRVFKLKGGMTPGLSKQIGLKG